MDAADGFGFGGGRGTAHQTRSKHDDQKRRGCWLQLPSNRHEDTNQRSYEGWGLVVLQFGHLPVRTLLLVAMQG